MFDELVEMHRVTSWLAALAELMHLQPSSAVNAKSLRASCAVTPLHCSRTGSEYRVAAAALQITNAP
ncbi:uncharacterized protein PHALS_00421 [Plasmopara halstedii]|uniref:Uncharacterized protein n=1 Tax=Plasmopara halstedii TaxID=4781 RepID=A0A0P1A7E6_PLAHL|nr:uncharacterized protein PHALS_00421 [Plasmopara halstedii]CEG36102.1 hypothetical protein PHALS_00421 [Plasmopara halstedii]|eukprot:XP_024572471.1 hypothetical protein PHALS_00421 [Plasmopara halstedii]